jgi:S1-C subfamily serine protease
MPVVHCPTCRQALTVADGLGGAVVTCPACQQAMTLPSTVPAVAAPAVVAQPDYIEPFAVPDPAPVRDREHEPVAGRERKTDWTPVILVGAAGFLGLIGVVIVVVMLAGNSKPNSTGKDKTEQVKADRPAPAPKAKGEPVAAVSGRMDDATVARIKKATVYIRTTGAKSISEGSGFFVDKNMVLTNHHVINHPGRLEVVVEKGTPQAQTYRARVVGSTAEPDLAIIEVDGAIVAQPLTVSDTSGLLETHDVYAFGFPLGERLGQEITVTRTSVSSKRNSGQRGREIQLHGGLVPGNSGGPITDSSGRVVGVVRSMIGGTSINFAIAGEEVQTFLTRFHER